MIFFNPNLTHTCFTYYYFFIHSLTLFMCPIVLFLPLFSSLFVIFVALCVCYLYVHYAVSTAKASSSCGPSISVWYSWSIKRAWSWCWRSWLSFSRCYVGPLIITWITLASNICFAKVIVHVFVVVPTLLDPLFLFFFFAFILSLPHRPLLIYCNFSFDSPLI